MPLGLRADITEEALDVVVLQVLIGAVREVQRVPDLTGEPFPSELLLRLKHLILSHHGTYEFGSPKLPMTPEAIALHHLDNFDAKVHSFTRDIREDHEAGEKYDNDRSPTCIVTRRDSFGASTTRSNPASRVGLDAV